MKKILLCGYFSLPYKVCTAGDLLVAQKCIQLFKDLDLSYDVLVEDPIKDLDNTVFLDDICVEDYLVLVFVCGPLVSTNILKNFLQKFNMLKKIALNVSLLDNHLEILQYFNVIIPRDSWNETNIDLAINTECKKTKLVGVILVGEQKEYKQTCHSKVEKIVDEVLKSRDFMSFYIDTKLPYNEYDLKNLKEVETIISKMDLIITTRLHGSIIALKYKIPFIAIDPVVGGAKITKQLNIINWPFFDRQTYSKTFIGKKKYEPF